MRGEVHRPAVPHPYFVGDGLATVRKTLAGGRPHVVPAFGYLPMRYGHKAHNWLAQSRICASCPQVQSKHFSLIARSGFGIPSFLALPSRFRPSRVAFIGIISPVCPLGPQWGICEPGSCLHARAPTRSFRHNGLTPAQDRPECPRVMALLSTA